MTAKKEKILPANFIFCAGSAPSEKDRILSQICNEAECLGQKIVQGVYDLRRIVGLLGLARLVDLCAQMAKV